MFEIHSPVAQSVEQVAVNHPVGGSNPSRGDKCGTEMYRISFSGRNVKKRLQISPSHFLHPSPSKPKHLYSFIQVLSDLDVLGACFLALSTLDAKRR